MQGVRTGVKLFAAAAALAATFPLAAGAAGQGPRASVSVATVCALNKTTANFLVELRVKDKTSGSAVPQVTGYSISALAKTQSGNWSNQEVFAQSSKSGLSTKVPAIIRESFSLCTGGVINPMIADAKGLNAMASTTYGAVGGTESRTVMNMCSDDLDTLDVVEPAGIKLTANDINDISNVCKAQQP